jgi:ABC-type transport system involved in multi-copper enzyme maturation permease subunit
MIRLVWVEVRKLLHTAPVWITTALCLLFTVWAYATTRRTVAEGGWDPNLLDPEFSLTYASANLATVGSFLTVFIGAVSVGMEFSYKTWPAMLTHGAKRWQVWLAKVCAVVGLVGAWVFVTLILGYLSSLWAGERFALPAVSAAVLAQVGVLLYALLFWAMFAFTFALAFRGTGAGVAVGILFPYANLLAEGGNGSIKLWLPIWNQRALYAAAWGTEMDGVAGFYPDPMYPPVWQAVTVLAVMLTVLVMVSFYLVRNLRTD